MQISNDRIMKKFLADLSIFVFIVVLLLSVCEVLARHADNVYKRKDADLMKQANDIETLIVGPSTMYSGIDPRYLTHKAYNYGLPSSSMPYDVFILNKYIDSCRNLKYVILNLSYLSPYYQLERFGDDSRYAMCYHVYLDCNIHTKFSKYNLEIASPGHAIEQIISLLHKTEYSYDENGFNRGRGIVDRSKWEQMGKEHAISTTEADKSGYADNMRALEHAGKLCKERGLSLLIITAPMTSYYRDLFDDGQLSRMYNMASQMEEQFPGTVKYLDYLDDERFTDDDFSDDMHLNNEGAKKLTMMINSEITTREHLRGRL